ncbi:MAG: peptidoglycan bridge formation protein FemAB [Gammaproteobacteria bacterium]|nr:MAG: peptidoglycan bridge formation protein FemAB [Gammaproteobacteria bacterium]
MNLAASLWQTALERAGLEHGVEVQRLENTAEATREWDDFVEACPRATFFHLSGWRRVYRRACGYRDWFLAARRDGRLVGVLPLAEVRSRLFGHRLVAAPLAVYGGPAAADPAAEAALEDAACALAERLSVAWLELRRRQDSGRGRPHEDLYVTFRRPLPSDPEAAFAQIPRKQRAMVRKGEAAGLEAVIDDDVDGFWRVYAESVRNLGTPVYARRYFHVLREVFGPRCRVLGVRHRGRAVAAVMSFYFRDEVLPYYGGGTARARSLKANDFMYWSLMRQAVLDGCRVFDYGRSKRDTGAYHFKKNWGFTPQPLHYEYHLLRRREPPRINPLNPRYRLFVAAWRRLPLAVARRLGPWLARGLA